MSPPAGFFNANPFLSPILDNLFGLFFLYGIYASATEGISKAWISNIIDKKDTATAIGTYSGFQSICTMLASSLTGLIWFQFGATIAFLVTGIATVLIIVYFVLIPKTTIARNGAI
jgi:Mg2+/Co2+ transporter CorB